MNQGDETGEFKQKKLRLVVEYDRKEEEETDQMQESKSTPVGSPADFDSPLGIEPKTPALQVEDMDDVDED